MSKSALIVRHARCAWKTSHYSTWCKTGQKGQGQYLG